MRACVRENLQCSLRENFDARQDHASEDLIEIRISRCGKLRLTNFTELANESTLRESGLAFSLSLFPLSLYFVAQKFT